MSELILPHSIDAGTPMVANEVQSNFVAIRDIVNGQLQGGSGSNGNMAANGITYRELAHNLMKYYTKGPVRQEGVFTFASLRVTPSAGMTVAIAAGEAMVRDDSAAVLDAGMLVPGKLASGTTITLDNAHATLPRVDQVVARLTDYETVSIEKITGTPTSGAQVATPSAANYRAGAGSLGNDRILLADILVPATDTTIDASQIIDRRGWATGEMVFELTGITSSNKFQVVSDLDSSVDVGYELTFTGLVDDTANFGSDTNRFVLLTVNNDTAVASYHSVTRRILQNGGTITNAGVSDSGWGSPGAHLAYYMGFTGTQDYQLHAVHRLTHHLVAPGIMMTGESSARRSASGTTASSTSAHTREEQVYFPTAGLKSLEVFPDSTQTVSGKLHVRKLWTP